MLGEWKEGRMEVSLDKTKLALKKKIPWGGSASVTFHIMDIINLSGIRHGKTLKVSLKPKGHYIFRNLIFLQVYFGKGMKYVKRGLKMNRNCEPCEDAQA